MQKTLRKPENWQDFESLCKKLWGELWDIPYKIKKNGRLGQLQHGVDVYGIPKGENGHWGIQCKGKNDDYLNATLTKKEIDKEINSAKNFSPKLEVFIIATTQSKDVVIEQYVREKDVESRATGGFEVILFCWEDIVDLIQENRETLNWYLQINNFRETYDFDVTFSNGANQITVNPKFLKLITKYRNITEPSTSGKNILDISQRLQLLVSATTPYYGSSEINKSWCTLEITLKNTGSVTLENWYLKLKVDEAMKISDGFYVSSMLNEATKKMVYDSRVLWQQGDSNNFTYKPLRDNPLVQKASKTFEIMFIPNFDQRIMRFSWQLFARDFDKTGILIVELMPDFKEEVKYIKVEKEEHFKEDNIEIKELIEKKNK